MADSASARLVSIGGDTLRLNGEVGFGVASQERGRIQAFFTAERSRVSRVSAVIGNRVHQNDNVVFLVQPGERVCFFNRTGLIGSLKILGLSADKKSVVVH